MEQYGSDTTTAMIKAMRDASLVLLLVGGLFAAYYNDVLFSIACFGLVALGVITRKSSFK
jgi:hypothetical protein